MRSKADPTERLLNDRRQVLKAVGGSAAFVSLSGLTACGGGESPAPEAPANPQPENVTGTGNDTRMAEPADPQAADSTTQAAQQPVTEPAPDAAAADAGGQPASSGGMPRLDPSDPQAQSLAYVHNASSINADQQPRYESGQACRNCALYLGEEGAQWGGCSIFPGKLVNADGWCNVYSPKA